MPETSDQSGRPKRHPALSMLAESDQQYMRAMKRGLAESHGLHIRGPGETPVWLEESWAAQQTHEALKQLGLPPQVEFTSSHGARATGEGAVRTADEVAAESRFMKRLGMAIKGGRQGPSDPIVWAKTDEQGKLHNDDGPAAVTRSGMMMFMKRGDLAPGPDGFSVIKTDGSAYRSSERALENPHVKHVLATNKDFHAALSSDLQSRATETKPKVARHERRGQEAEL